MVGYGGYVSEAEFPQTCWVHSMRVFTRGPLTRQARRNGSAR